MKLSYEQIKEITRGFIECDIGNGGIEFYRFSKNHYDKVELFNKDHAFRAKSQSSICFDFETDSEYFSFSYDNIVKASSQSWYYFSLLINGKEVDLIGEKVKTVSSGKYETKLDKGKKRITLVFSNLYRTRINGVELSDNAYFKRVEPTKTYLFYGDSITQGYCAISSAKSYVNRFALSLNAEIFNMAIGGAHFDEELIDENLNKNFDGIFIAYGTNDWSHRQSFEEFSLKCEDYFKKLYSIYNNTPIYVILPIWRPNFEDYKPVGTFFEVRDRVKEIAKAYKNVNIIDLIDDIPKNNSLFVDLVHPNDEGFSYYAQGLLNKFSGK